MKENALKNKSKAFAIRVIKLFQYLQTDKKEFVLSKQLLRSGTAIGALYREAEQAESKADFIHKLVIALKECNESMYWLELLHETDYITIVDFKCINMDATEILKMLISIIKTTKANLKK